MNVLTIALMVIKTAPAINKGMVRLFSRTEEIHQKLKNIMNKAASSRMFGFIAFHRVIRPMRNCTHIIAKATLRKTNTTFPLLSTVINGKVHILSRGWYRHRFPMHSARELKELYTQRFLLQARVAQTLNIMSTLRISPCKPSISWGKPSMCRPDASGRHPDCAIPARTPLYRLRRGLLFPAFHFPAGFRTFTL